jgi:hypothetical protein
MLMMHEKGSTSALSIMCSVFMFMMWCVLCDAHAYAPILCLVFQRFALLLVQVISWLCLGGHGEALQFRLHRLVIHLQSAPGLLRGTFSFRHIGHNAEG